jgi:hypothetical protein
MILHSADIEIHSVVSDMKCDDECDLILHPSQEHLVSTQVIMQHNYFTLSKCDSSVCAMGARKNRYTNSYWNDAQKGSM